MSEFRKFPSIPRLNKPMTITEKIDGTNAAVVIRELTTPYSDEADLIEVAGYAYQVYAQSRSRVITPGKQTDNHGFAGYVRDNARELVLLLGEGFHYGEWWGSGINRGYGLQGGEKHFSLFNVARYAGTEPEVPRWSSVPNLHTVPVLYEGTFSTYTVRFIMDGLRQNGSVAAPGYTHPEGVVVFNQAANQLFKATFDYDEGKWTSK